MSADNHNEGFGLGRLALVLAGLLVLTAVTVAVSTVDLGALKITVALLIASAKATLVLFFFMEIGHSGRLVKISFIGTIITLAFFIGFLFFDVALR